MPVSASPAMSVMRGGAWGGSRFQCPLPLDQGPPRVDTVIILISCTSLFRRVVGIWAASQHFSAYFEIAGCAGWWTARVDPHGPHDRPSLAFSTARSEGPVPGTPQTWVYNIHMQRHRVLRLQWRVHGGRGRSVWQTLGVDLSLRTRVLLPRQDVAVEVSSQANAVRGTLQSG